MGRMLHVAPLELEGPVTSVQSWTVHFISICTVGTIDRSLASRTLAYIMTTDILQQALAYGLAFAAFVGYLSNIGMPERDMRRERSATEGLRG